MEPPPYAASRFAVEVDGRPLAVSEVLGLGWTHDEKPAALVTLRRAAGADRALLEWARKPTARTVVVTLQDGRGEAAATYLLRGARPVSWLGPQLDARSADLAMEELVLAVDHLDLR